MNIVIGFSPWLLFWVLAPYYSIHATAGISLALSFIVNLRSFWKRYPKILEICSFIFLAALTITSLLMNSDEFRQWSRTMGNAAMFVTAFVSIIVGKPFALQYAHEELPKERWNSPELYRVCLTITWVWTILFFVTILTAISIVYWEHPIPWLISLSHTVLFTGAMTFTRLYRRKVHRHENL